MRIRDLTNEASPDTLEGSFTDDLVISKTWLADKLKQGYKDKCVRTIYILGSWYGNLAYFLQKAGLVFDNIVLIDKDTNVLKKSEKLLRPIFEPGKLIFIDTDAKDVIYDKPGIVINTSINDMDVDWYDNVPDGMRVVIQGRDATSGPTRIADMKQFTDMFPMSKTEYLGKKELSDPETEYTRYMKIGKK
ncbi:MAG: hypothetical protein EB127_24325 [Alphaproteobacteria bacterium]|nr:hypothetical protein [Alphaproteobacteria bacterium]